MSPRLASASVYIRNTLLFLFESDLVLVTICSDVPHYRGLIVRMNSVSTIYSVSTLISTIYICTVTNDLRRPRPLCQEPGARCPGVPWSWVMLSAYPRLRVSVSPRGRVSRLRDNPLIVREQLDTSPRAQPWVMTSGDIRPQPRAGPSPSKRRN